MLAVKCHQSLSTMQRPFVFFSRLDACHHTTSTLLRAHFSNDPFAMIAAFPRPGSPCRAHRPKHQLAGISSPRPAGFLLVAKCSRFPGIAPRQRLPVRVPNKWRGRMKRLDEIAIEWECVKVIMQYAQAVNDWDIHKFVSDRKSVV